MVGDEVGVENVADAHLGSVVGAAEIGADAGIKLSKHPGSPVADILQIRLRR